MVILEETPVEALASRQAEIMVEYMAAGHPLANRSPLMVRIIGPEVPRDDPDLDRIILAEIRYGKPFWCPRASRLAVLQLLVDDGR